MTFNRIPGMNFTATLEDSMPLCRYMNFYGLMSLLQTKKVYFSQLTSFSDPQEGTFLGTAQHILPPEIMPELTREQVRDNLQMHLRATWLPSVYASCWTNLDHESWLLWQRYKDASCVMLKTTYGRIRDSIKSKQLEFYADHVVYVNEEEPTWSWNAIHQCFTKNRYYCEEKEFRILFNDNTLLADIQKNPIAGRIAPKGLGFEVDLEVLIDSLVLAPGMPEWISAVVRASVKKELPTLPVQCSRIATKPLYS